MEPKVFPIIPGSAAPVWMLGGIISLMLLLAGLFAGFLYSVRHVTFELSGQGLRVRGDLYGRRVPLEALRSLEARRVNLESEAQYRPTLRTNGLGLPGYLSGWFRLKNGDKALLFLTDRTRAVYIPTARGYSLLLSVADPDGFLEALKQSAKRAG
ncbi:MAG: hypothetical protein IT210_14695 [Armatimonadetes bacterium]|nr:hypothetical protein [Armatimonadota bacterium]